METRLKWKLKLAVASAFDTGGDSMKTELMHSLAQNRGLVARLTTSGQNMHAPFFKVSGATTNSYNFSMTDVDDVARLTNLCASKCFTH